MTDEESNFILITKINEFPMKEIVPMSIAYSYPFLAVVTSPTEILTFNFETKVTMKLERKTTYNDSVVLCSVISDDKALIATGHNDSYGGEVVIWSLATRTEVIAFRLAEGVAQVQFGLTSDSILHSDSMGILTLSTITTKFFKKVVNHQLFQDFQSPLVSMAVHKRHLFVSSSTVTQVFSLDFLRDNVVWRENEATSCFAFLDTPTENYVARGVGHNVVVTTLNGKNPHTYEFSRTPNVVSFIDLNTVLVLFSGKCEMIRENVRFHRKVPPGIALALSDRIFIAGSDLLQLSLASVEQRVGHYIIDNNWNKVFEQINSPNDYPDICALLNRYIAYEKFDPNYLFKIAEKLGKIEFVTNLMFNQKEDLILNAFIENTKIHWYLNENFILKIFETIQDSEKLTQFLLSTEINLEWLPQIFHICMKRNMLSVVSQLSLEYCADYLLNLLLDHYQGHFQGVHNLMDILLISQKVSPMSAITYLENTDLTDVVLYNIDHSVSIFSSSFEYLIYQRMPIEKLVNRIIMGIDKDADQIWAILAPLIISKKIKVNKELIPRIENYIYASANGDKNTRGDLLVHFLNTEQIIDTQRALDLVRNSGLQSCELAIIISIHDVDEYFSYVIDNNKNGFREDLYKVVKDTSILCQIFKEKAYLLMSVNPDEFCDEVMKMNSTPMIHEIVAALSKNKALEWHFMKRILCRPEFAESANSDEILKYITYLASYCPTQVYSALRSFHDIPLDKVLKLCKNHGIVDATLYLCGLSHDFEEVLRFGKAALETSLMENQSSLVVTQVCNYLTSSVQENKNEIWLQFLSTFQIPVFAYMFDPRIASPEKLQPILDLLSEFLDSMVRDIENADIIVDKFIELFSFLPFKIARPIVTQFFKSIREKNQFTGTLVQIEKYEAVNIQMNRMKDLAKGKEYDGIRCANCAKLLGQSDVIAFHCGHVFHTQCSTSGWCKLCEVAIESKEKELATLQMPEKAQPPQNLLITMDVFSDEIPKLDIFSRKDNDQIHHQNMFQPPKIGVVTIV